jgi:hypothetical protein
MRYGRSVDTKRLGAIAKASEGTFLMVSASQTQLGCRRVKYWEIIANNLSKDGWSWGCVSALDCEGRTIWIVDAHRGGGKRFVVRADEELTAFLELELAIQAYGELI